jgi:hypothetical protein
MRAVARTSYSVLIALHPQQFRAEFGQEMLWIFDEEMQSGSNGKVHVQHFTRLLLDALRSLLIQHTLRIQKSEVGGSFQTAPSPRPHGALDWWLVHPRLRLPLPGEGKRSYLH